MEADCVLQPDLDFWGLTEQDHIDAKVEDCLQETHRNFRPEPQHLVDRYYGSREEYICALERQAAFDKEAVSLAKDAPASWRLSRLVNAASCALKAELERAALAA